MSMTITRICAIACAVLAAACTKPPEPATNPRIGKSDATSVAWINTKTTADVDAAFTRANAEKKPVFLFWTAAWCPPCNHVKSTIFTRDEFVSKSRAFVPVYVDGDTPSGQALGQRFNVSGYPTMVLLTADGNEVTRLEGSVEPAKYMQLLDYGLSGGASARQLLASALSGKPISTEDWRLLAYYSWGTDHEQLVSEKQVPATLLKLAGSCPPTQREACSRLVLQALAAISTTQENERPAINKADAVASIKSVLAQPELVREHYDQLAFSGDDIVGAITAPTSAERIDLVKAWSNALDGLTKDPTLSRTGRLWATSGKVALMRLNNKDGGLAEPLLAEVRAQAESADRETTDPNERQSVIYSAGSMLARAGLLEESDALMTRELKRSHSPYYYMLALASNAKKRNTPAGNAAAVDWARQAYETSVGSATRIEWGASYLRYLVDLAPDDAAQIEKAAASVIGELRSEPGAFSGRSKRTLERMSGRLATWNKNGSHDAELVRLNAKVRPICAHASADSADRAACENLFKPGRA
jgi:thioredoxin-related protein